MRILLLALLLITTSLCAKAQNVTKEIKKTTKEIHSYDRKYSSLHKKLSHTAKEIKKTEKDLSRQEKEISKLSEQLKVSQNHYASNQKELAQLQDKQLLLQGKQGLIEKELINAIARNISINDLVKEKYNATTESVMTEEILEALNRDIQHKITRLEENYSANAKDISSYQSRTKKLKTEISSIDKKKARLLKLTQESKSSLKKMQKEKKRYRRSMDKLIAQKRALKNTLARLNIIKSEAQKKAEKPRRQKKNSHAKVTKKGSSYQRVRSKKYRGKKTIAPLSNYKLVKKFGPYTDPIYKIKIYNESVSLQPRQRNAKVRTILNGKVILAKKTQLLDNVVIIKHSNGLHTIYAHLDQIAPTIRKGKKVKRGAIIGRVNNELTFEVTQDSYHIDPMTLIK